jgi:hypothetical protein
LLYPENIAGFIALLVGIWDKKARAHTPKREHPNHYYFIHFLPIKQEKPMIG